jgi:hypothetical protein
VAALQDKRLPLSGVEIRCAYAALERHGAEEHGLQLELSRFLLPRSTGPSFSRRVALLELNLFFHADRCPDWMQPRSAVKRLTVQDKFCNIDKV